MPLVILGNQTSGGPPLVLKTPPIVDKHAQLYSMSTYKLVMDAVESELFVKEGAKDALLYVSWQCRF